MTAWVVIWDYHIHTGNAKNADMNGAILTFTSIHLVDQTLVTGNGTNL